LKVTPDGNDAAAVAACGATPFRSVQAAIDFAGANQNIATSVCVAGGAACSNAASYGDAAMRSGISVHGSYESTGWTRCATRTTELRPVAAHGVYFGPDVSAQTALDWFVVLPASGASPMAAVTLEGAEGVVLSFVDVRSGTAPRAVDAFGDADFVVADSRIAFGAQATGISTVGSRLTLERSEVLGLDVRTTLANPATGVVLDAAPDSIIDETTITASGGGSVVTALVIRGDGGGIEVQRSTIFEHNDFAPPLSYQDENFTLLTTPAAVNALTDMTVSGTLDFAPAFASDPHLSSASPLIDAGTTVGAPAYDIDGELRISPPDIGADEWSAANDPCAGFCANGSCVEVNESLQCTCNGGYQHPTGQPLVCEDIDECATNNGSCDPLTQCTNTAGSRTYGPCPSGYTGTGSTGCVDVNECATNNGDCDPLTTCNNVGGGRTCGPCPAGYSGDGESGCVDETPLVELCLGRIHGCGLRGSGAIECWGESANHYGNARPVGETFDQISCRHEHTCALRIEGGPVL
jgi:hypothetical protein